MQVTAKLSLAKGQGHRQQGLGQRAAGGRPEPVIYSDCYFEPGQTLGEKSKIAPPFPEVPLTCIPQDPIAPPP